jgi:hypothetical protein
MLTRLYSSIMWLLFVAGAPLLTLALAVFIIPLLLTEVRAGLILMLLPGVLTLAPLWGLLVPGDSPRADYVTASGLALLRVLAPLAIVIGWYNYLEPDAREGLALALLLLATCLVSLPLWAWSVDYALVTAPNFETEWGERVVAKRVDIASSLRRDDRRALRRTRDRNRRIESAIAATHAPEAPERVVEPQEVAPAVIWVESNDVEPSVGWSEDGEEPAEAAPAVDGARRDLWRSVGEPLDVTAAQEALVSAAAESDGESPLTEDQAEEELAKQLDDLEAAGEPDPA